MQIMMSEKNNVHVYITAQRF